MDESKQTNDHDILIELRTIVKGLVADVKSLNDTTVKRITDIENNKVDKAEAVAEATRLEKEIEKTAKTLSDTVENTRKALSESAEKTTKDYEERLRTLETAKTEMQTQIKTWVVMGGAVWSAISAVIIHFMK